MQFKFIINPVFFFSYFFVGGGGGGKGDYTFMSPQEKVSQPAA